MGNRTMRDMIAAGGEDGRLAALAVNRLAMEILQLPQEKQDLVFDALCALPEERENKPA